MFVIFPVHSNNAARTFGFTESAGAQDKFVAWFDFCDIAVLEVLGASDLNDFAIFLDEICAKLAKRRKFAVGIHDETDIQSRVVRRNSSGTSKTGKTYAYYKCSNQKKRHNCPKKTISKEKIEDVVVKVVMEKIMNDQMMKELAHRLYDLQNQESDILTALQAQLLEVERGIDNMLNAIQSGIVLDSTKKRLAELEERQKQLMIDITQEQIKKPSFTTDEILFAIHKFRRFDITTQEGKKRLIDCFVNSVYLFDEYALVVCNFKEGTTKVTIEDIEDSDFGNFVEMQKNKSEQKSSDLFAIGDPNGTRTHVTTVKGWCLNRLTNGPSM